MAGDVVSGESYSDADRDAAHAEAARRLGQRPGYPPGWLSTEEASAVGQHPFRPGATNDERCVEPACGAISGDPIHFTPTGILTQGGA